jgi:hypothetical protein
MADVSRVQQLLDELLDSECTPEVVCGDCPELLPEVRQRWQQMRIIEAELDAMFPTPGPNPDAETSTPWHAGAVLPRVPGYEVKALLGRGGMGIVYKARHLRLNRVVALKMLIAGTYAGPHERARFRRTWRRTWLPEEGWRRPVPLGRNPWKAIRRNIACGMAMPSSVCSCVTRKRTVGLAGPCLIGSETPPSTGSWPSAPA